jgi:exonuclease SbcC
MINHVEMENWRAYDQRSFDFEPGITFVMGPNGIGKTSILEAIAYALTGEPATVERPRLLRNPDKFAKVQLSFTMENEVYQIVRSQSAKRAKQAWLTRQSDGEVLARSHKAVTSQVERLMNVSADFLSRIIYMAEGDVFRFLNKPPGDAVNQQIRHIMGLYQLDAFQTALKKAKKTIYADLRQYATFLEQLEQLDIVDDEAFEQKVHQLNSIRDQLQDQLTDLQNQINQYERENEKVLRFAPLVTQAVEAFSSTASIEKSLRQQPVLETYEYLEEEITKARSKIKNLDTAIARLEGEMTGYQRVLDILHSYSGKTKTVPCPVCGKPMTAQEREQAEQRIRANMDTARRDLEGLREQQSKKSKHERHLKRLKDGLKELRNYIAHVRIKGISSQSTLQDMEDLLARHRRSKRSHLKDLENQQSNVRTELNNLEKARAEYLALEKSLSAQGFTSIQDLRTTAVQLETRLLSIKAAETATTETLAYQRDLGLEEVYAQIARMWEAFLGHESGTWDVKLDRDGMPEIIEGDRAFDFSQFSGGQKTAFLVMLHTIISRHFSKSDFLMIDEPLEHLDPVNRRSLLRFLVNAYRGGAFQQAIITTYEEALIRKYMAEDEISVLLLT